MHHLPVGVALPSQFRRIQSYCAAVCFLLAFACLSLTSFNAYSQSSPSFAGGGYVARINNDSPEEVADALRRAESLYNDGLLVKGADPLAIVLHGPEVEVFFKDNYDEYKDIVDLAQRLSELGIVQVRVCETQAGILGRSRSSIHPFIGTINFGPTEVNRLLKQQNYVYF